MRKLARALAVLAAMAATPAQAALAINLAQPSATFRNANVFCSSRTPCNFTDTITFTTPADYDLVSASISTVAVDGVRSASDIDLTLVTLDGVAFSMTRLLNGVFEVGGLSGLPFWAPGTHTLTIRGISYGSQGLDGSYSGTLNFATNATPQMAIPEPAVWLALILGFAAIGHSQRKQSQCVNRAEIDLNPSR